MDDLINSLEGAFQSAESLAVVKKSDHRLAPLGFCVGPTSRVLAFWDFEDLPILQTIKVLLSNISCSSWDFGKHPAATRFLCPDSFLET